MIGGLLTSMALSLLVVPVVFTYVDDVLQWFRRHLRFGHHAPASGLAAAPGSAE